MLSANKPNDTKQPAR